MSEYPDLLRDSLRPSAGSGAAGRAPIDLTDPAGNLRAFGKLWGTFGDEPVLGVFHGVMYGAVGDAALRPLFGYAGTGVTRCRVLDNGHVQMRGKETGYFTDLRTGEVLDAWHNPYTGERVETFAFLNDRIGGELTFEMPRLQLGDDANDAALMNEASAVADAGGTVPFVLPWQRFGDELLLEWDYAHRYRNPVTADRWPTASTGSYINPSEHFVIYASHDEVTDPDTPTAHFRAGFSRLSPWWPWMRMGSGPDGRLFGRLFSRTARRGLDDVPRPVLDRILRDAPDHLEMPSDWELGPILSSWEAYAASVPPEVS